MKPKKKPQNPFLITGYHTPEYFCDREQETATIKNALSNGRNITLIAPRRMGKTGLIMNVFHHLKKVRPEVVVLYMDIYSTQSLGDFTRQFASTVLGSLDSAPQKAIKRVGEFIKSIHPVITFDELTGAPKIRVDIIPGSEEATLKELFEYLASSERQCIIAIDEFQQICEYQEKGVEALLRSHIQFLPNVNFIFAGSKHHIMQEMFISAKRPFYQSTQIISIDSIDKHKYYDFVSGFFEKSKLSAPLEVFGGMYDEFDGHTWYIQSILNRVYGYKKSLSEESVNRAIEEIVTESTYAYQTLVNTFTHSAIKLLKAIANERCVKEINSGDFISKHGLKAASSVNSSLKRLLDKEMVYKSESGYIVYDRFLSIWLRQQTF